MAFFDMWIQVSGFQIPVLDSVFKGYPITCAMAQSWGVGDDGKGKGKKALSPSLALSLPNSSCIPPCCVTCCIKLYEDDWGEVSH